MSIYGFPEPPIDPPDMDECTNSRDCPCPRCEEEVEREEREHMSQCFCRSCPSCGRGMKTVIDHDHAPDCELFPNSRWLRRPTTETPAF